MDIAETVEPSSNYRSHQCYSKKVAGYTKVSGLKFRVTPLRFKIELLGRARTSYSEKLVCTTKKHE